VFRFCLEMLQHERARAVEVGVTAKEVADDSF
jgi:hypothetical protein